MIGGIRTVRTVKFFVGGKGNRAGVGHPRNQLGLRVCKRGGRNGWVRQLRGRG